MPCFSKKVKSLQSKNVVRENRITLKFKDKEAHGKTDQNPPIKIHKP